MGVEDKNHQFEGQVESPVHNFKVSKILNLAFNLSDVQPDVLYLTFFIGASRVASCGGRGSIVCLSAVFLCLAMLLLVGEGMKHWLEAKRGR